MSKHPVYAEGDPKAGQPVLIGDKFLIAMQGNAYGPFTATRIDQNGVWDNTAADGPCIMGGARILSVPPVPAIESCVCGRSDQKVRGVAGGEYRVSCACGRCGMAVKPGEQQAIEVWNADMLAMKKGRKG